MDPRPTRPTQAAPPGSRPRCPQLYSVRPVAPPTCCSRPGRPRAPALAHAAHYRARHVSPTAAAPSTRRGTALGLHPRSCHPFTRPALSSHTHTHAHTHTHTHTHALSPTFLALRTNPITNPSHHPPNHQPQPPTNRHPVPRPRTWRMCGSGITSGPASRSPTERDTHSPPGHSRSGPTPSSPCRAGPCRWKPSGARVQPAPRNRACSSGLDWMRWLPVSSRMEQPVSSTAEESPMLATVSR